MGYKNHGRKSHRVNCLLRYAAMIGFSLVGWTSVKALGPSGLATYNFYDAISINVTDSASFFFLVCVTSVCL